jgi:hypothetical protein
MAVLSVTLILDQLLRRLKNNYSEPVHLHTPHGNNLCSGKTWNLYPNLQWTQREDVLARNPQISDDIISSISRKG